MVQMCLNYCWRPNAVQSAIAPMSSSANSQQFVCININDFHKHKHLERHATMSAYPPPKRNLCLLVIPPFPFASCDPNGIMLCGQGLRILANIESKPNACNLESRTRTKFTAAVYNPHRYDRTRRGKMVPQHATTRPSSVHHFHIHERAVAKLDLQSDEVSARENFTSDMLPSKRPL
jgi:hypothetical protein